MAMIPAELRQGVQSLTQKASKESHVAIEWSVESDQQFRLMGQGKLEKSNQGRMGFRGKERNPKGQLGGLIWGGTKETRPKSF